MLIDAREVRPASPVDFVIIGAGKSGTTSLYYYLAQHPEIFLSPAKEPRFFLMPGAGVDTTATERMAFHQEFPLAPCTMKQYEELFRDARPQQLCGEASIQYLTSEQAARNIGRYAPEAKLLCILRNPVDRAYSNYLHAVRDGYDTDTTVLAALERDGIGHVYFDGGFYGRQLSWYATHAPDNPLRVWLYEELETEPVRVVREIFEYLGVDPAFVPDMSFRANVSGEAREGNVWAVAYDWVRTTRARQTRLARRFLSVEMKQWVIKELGRRADAGRTKARMTELERAALYEIYREDLDILEGVLDRNLDAWRPSSGSRVTQA